MNGKYISCRVFDSGSVDFLQLHKRFPQRYPFLLESVANNTPTARFDILFAFPQQQLALINQQLCGEGCSHPNFLTRLDQLWSEQRIVQHSDGNIPFRGGWFIYLSYEMSQQIEPCLPSITNDNGVPQALAVRIPAALIYDHQLQRTLLVAENEFLGYLDVMWQDCWKLCQDHQAKLPLPLLSLRLTEESPQHYLDRIQRVLAYIREGDVFQVNLSRLWQGQVTEDFSYIDAYARLRQHNPATFAGLLHWDGWSVMSSSPERLVNVSDGMVATRPIAGTRPRMRENEPNNSQEERVKAELMAHPKERAEHVMLIDLARNDLGRVCQPGSVDVNEFMVLETYAHVHHIVSNVRGKLMDDYSPGKLIRAVFPGGTITGCPKIRCMQIIAELEQTTRGAYTGSMGYLNRNGDMDLNILIRTIEQHQSSLSFRAGAGIVADSDPQLELAETRAKAKGLLLALGANGDQVNGDHQ